MNTIKVKKSQIRTCIKNAQITKSQKGMFIPYEFIVYNVQEQNFYSSVQASSNSFTNYPGVKLWDNKGEVTKATKSELVDYIFDYMQDVVLENQELSEFEFEFIG